MSRKLVPVQVANAPCSWGALEFDLPGQGVTCATVLDEIKETGYDGTELGDWGFMPTSPKVLRTELDARGLHLVGAFVPVAFNREGAYAEGEERALKTARLMAEAVGGQPFIVLADDNGKDPTRTKLAGRITPPNSLSPGQWSAYGEQVNRLASAIRRHTGLRSVFHHHCAGLVEAPWEIEALLHATDPSLVGLCFDTGHYRFGGGTEPVKLMERFGDRIWHVHFKDCNGGAHTQSRENNWDYFDSIKHGIFCELGKGDVPFPDVVAKLRQMQYQGWIVVEQDVLPGMGVPKEYARSNRQFLKAHGI